MSAQKNAIVHDTLYMSETFSDVTIEVNYTQIPAHKALLASKSEVFKGRLDGDVDKYTIEGVTASAFLEFLQFFYLDQVRLTVGNIDTIVRLVQEFEVKTAYGPCETFMRDTCTSQTALRYYNIAVKHDLSSKMIDWFEEIVCFDPMDVLRHTKSPYLDDVAKQRLLTSNYWRVKETFILQLAVSLAETELLAANREITGPNLRSALGTHLSLIGFPLMHIEDFIRCSLQYPNLLTQDEYFEVFNYIVEQQPLMVANHFRNKPRFRIFGVNLLSHRPRITADQNPQRVHEIIFKIDRIDGYTSIALVVVALHASAKHSERKDLHVRVVNVKTGAVLSNFSIMSKMRDNCYPVCLPRSVHLQPEEPYLLRVIDEDAELIPVDHKTACPAWPGFAMTVDADRSRSAVFDLQFKCWNDFGPVISEE